MEITENSNNVAIWVLQILHAIDAELDSVSGRMMDLVACSRAMPTELGSSICTHADLDPIRNKIHQNIDAVLAYLAELKSQTH